MAETVERLDNPRTVLMDGRGSGLRISWHDKETIAVFSLWHEDRCVGTFRAGPADMAAIVAFLSTSLADAATVAGIHQMPQTA